MRLVGLSFALVLTTGCWEADQADAPTEGAPFAPQLGAFDLDPQTASSLDGANWHLSDVPVAEVDEDASLWDDGFDPRQPMFLRYFVELSPDPLDETGRVWIGTERNSVENADGAIGCSIEWNMGGDHGTVPDEICHGCETDLAMTCANAQIVAGGYCDRWYSPSYIAATQRWYADFHHEYTRDDGVEVGTVWSRGTHPNSEWRPFVTGYRDQGKLYWDELKAF